MAYTEREYTVVITRDSQWPDTLSGWVKGMYKETWIAGPDIPTIFRRLGLQVALAENGGEQPGPLHDTNDSLDEATQLQLEGLASAMSPHHPQQEIKEQAEQAKPNPPPCECNKQRILNGERVTVACPRCGAGPCAQGIILRFDAKSQRMFDASNQNPSIRRGRAVPDQRDCP